MLHVQESQAGLSCALQALGNDSDAVCVCVFIRVCVCCLRRSPRPV